MSLEAAAQVMREAMRETVKRHSLWYLIQSGLMILAGILALVFPAISSVAVVVFLGWLLIVSGILQAISLIGARHVPHFWLQLVSVVLFILVGSLFLRNPGEGLLTLTHLLIVFFMVEGISKVIFALTIRPFPNWGWVLASGTVDPSETAGPLPGSISIVMSWSPVRGRNRSEAFLWMSSASSGSICMVTTASPFLRVTPPC
jgi:uncharacterized membrane protein HdeD (DUF308 family)